MPCTNIRSCAHLSTFFGLSIVKARVKQQSHLDKRWWIRLITLFHALESFNGFFEVLFGNIFVGGVA